MNQDTAAELRAALAEASQAIVPDEGLADRVMRAGRRHRRVRAGVLAAVLVVVATGTLAAVHQIAPARSGPSVGRHGHARARGLRIAAGSVDLVAAGAGQIYLAEGDYPAAVLAAYDRRTGRLIRQVAIPAMPSALRIGPGGLVWLCYYPDSNGGSTGVWLLSPDLAQRSGVDLGAGRYHGTAPFDILPAGRHSAILATSAGVARVRLPLPGQPGKPRLTWLPLTPGTDPINGPPVGLTSFAGRVAVRLASDDGHTIITFAGPRPPVYNPGPARGASSAAAGASGLWVTTFVRGGGQIGQHLIRLDARLRPDTPAWARRSALLAGTQQVLTLGGAIWATLLSAPWLACFADHGGPVGPVATLSTGFTPAGAAAIGDTIYLVGPAGVTSYHIPPQCR